MALAQRQGWACEEAEASTGPEDYASADHAVRVSAERDVSKDAGPGVSVEPPLSVGPEGDCGAIGRVRGADEEGGVAARGVSVAGLVPVVAGGRGAEEKEGEEERVGQRGG